MTVLANSHEWGEAEGWCGRGRPHQLQLVGTLHVLSIVCPYSTGNH
jgi:hypothetical protein